MRLDSRIVILALWFSTLLALTSTYAFAQDADNAKAPSVEALVKDGYEIKAVERGNERAPFLVLLQRGTEMKSCLMRIERGRGREPTRKSACF